MKMIHRPALRKDLVTLQKVFVPWSQEDPQISLILEKLFESGPHSKIRCTVLESDRTIVCASLWRQENPREVRLIGVGLGQSAPELGADVRFVREQILQWAEMEISKVFVTVPKAISSPIVRCLKTCGFMFEGISSSFALDSNPRIHLSKYFLYRSIAYHELMDFLREFLASLGYEVRSEGDGFGYRIRAEYRLPFIFSAWHRIAQSGHDIIVHPPARVLEMHELETIFFPLQVQGLTDKPQLIPMDKDRAKTLIDLPDLDAHQNSLFRGDVANRYRRIAVNNLMYCYPAGLKRLRRGLALLFYVNTIGVVGEGRVEDWYLDDPKSLYNTIDEMAYFDPEDVKEHAAASGPLAGKVLVIRFQWYRPLQRVVTLDQIRKLDVAFNPQRTRSLPTDLFQSILAAGKAPGP
jgi:hypothetical protein